MNEKIKRLEALLLEALYHASHAEDCAVKQFAIHGKPFPPNHPYWMKKERPTCSCWVGRAWNELNTKE